MSLFSRIAGTATLAALALALSALASPLAGAAIVPTQVNISPVGTNAAYYTVSVPAGGSRHLRVAFSNPGTSVAVAETYAADVYSVVNGGFGARLEDQPTTGVTNWLDYPAGTVRLSPGRSEQRSFTISVPEGASPGEHVTSLVVQQQAQTRSTGAVALDRVNRQALPIVIDVPGHLTAGVGIGTATPSNFAGHTSIAVGMTNTGNLRLHPDASLVVTNAQGKRVGAFTVKMGTVYPGDATTVQGTLSTALPPGHYTVAADLSDNSLGVTAQHENLPIDVTAGPHIIAAPVLTPASTRQQAQITRNLPITLLVGLVLAALLAGGIVAKGGARLRRQGSGSRGAHVRYRKGNK